MIVRLGKQSVVALLLLAVQGCGLSLPWSDNNSLRAVTVVSRPDSNANLPTAVDVVFIYDDTLASLLRGYAASDWFDQREAFQAGYPTGIKLLRWEVVPGSVGSNQALPADSRDALAVLVFADYAAPGTHRIDISDMQTVRLELAANTFSVSNQ